MPDVNSSAIRRIEHDELTHQLYVTFTKGKAYTFYAVPRSVYEAFLNASSQGTFYNDHIKGRYSFA
jgi:hypothetical protein